MIGSALSVRRPPEVLVAPQTAPHPPPPSSPGEGRLDDSRGDAVLAARLRCGDETALAEVYDLYGPTALAAARRATGDPHAAEEAVQEALLWVWTHADRFDPERGTLRAWLALLTHRRAVDWVRAESARRRRLPDGAEEPVASAEDSAIEAEDGARADRAEVAHRGRSPPGCAARRRAHVVLRGTKGQRHRRRARPARGHREDAAEGSPAAARGVPGR